MRREERKQTYRSALAALSELEFAAVFYYDESRISATDLSDVVQVATLRVEEVCLVGSEPTSLVSYKVLAKTQRFLVLAHGKDRKAAMEHYSELLSAIGELRESMRDDLAEKYRDRTSAYS